jgi:hypothetical protein
MPQLYPIINPINIRNSATQVKGSAAITIAAETILFGRAQCPEHLLLFCEEQCERYYAMRLALRARSSYFGLHCPAEK